MCVYPEGTAGDIDISPGDDDGVFDGLGGNVDTEEGSVSVICHLDVDGETLRILKQQTHPQHQRSQCASLSTEEQVENTSADYLRRCLRTGVQKNPQKHVKFSFLQMFQMCPQMFLEMILSSGHL